MTPKQIRAEVERLSPEDQQLAQRIARNVWEYIGGDCLQAMADDGKRNWMKRCEVIEVVLDADRYNEELKHELRKTQQTDNVARVDSLTRLIAFYDYKTGASYEAKQHVISPAFAAREGM